MKPTLHVTNWPSRKLHGPGRKWTIMATPRHWERGDGRISFLIPRGDLVSAVRHGHIPIEQYRMQYNLHLERWAPAMRPTFLWGRLRGQQGATAVADGDTCCCACSRATAAAGECHRVWAAEALVKAGWRVILDGVELEGA